MASWCLTCPEWGWDLVVTALFVAVFGMLAFSTVVNLTQDVMAKTPQLRYVPWDCAYHYESFEPLVNSLVSDQYPEDVFWVWELSDQDQTFSSVLLIPGAGYVAFVDS